MDWQASDSFGNMTLNLRDIMSFMPYELYFKNQTKYSIFLLDSVQPI